MQMDILLIAHFLNGFLMIAMPAGLAIFMTRRFQLKWRLWGIGAVTFVVSQVGHIPFNNVVAPLFSQPGFQALPELWRNLFYALFLGISAGMFEEFSRYAMFRWWAKDARSWGRGLLTGAGHGGIEAIILGVITTYAFIQLVVLRTGDLSSLVPADQLALAQQQVTQYWSMNWAYSLIGALERLFTIPCHLALGLLVMQTFTRKRWYWVWLAVLYHAMMDAGAVLGSIYLRASWTEAVIAGSGIISVLIIFALHKGEPEPLPEPAPALVIPSNFMPLPLEESTENLDNSRYQ
jgi:uncharacterized membrane protein YhfC